MRAIWPDHPHYVLMLTITIPGVPLRIRGDGPFRDIPLVVQLAGFGMNKTAVFTASMGGTTLRLGIYDSSRPYLQVIQFQMWRPQCVGALVILSISSRWPSFFWTHWARPWTRKPCTDNKPSVPQYEAISISTPDWRTQNWDPLNLPS